MGVALVSSEARRELLVKKQGNGVYFPFILQ